MRLLSTSVITTLCLLPASLFAQTTAELFGSGAPAWVTSGEPLYQPYAEATTRLGSESQLINGGVFLPLWQDQDTLLFADVRGQWTDQQAAEGNWGIGFRHITPGDRIVGAYGYFDLRHTIHNNTFHQGAFGFETLSVEDEFRINAYIPEESPQRANAASSARVSGGTIVVNAGEERAYYGIDFEFGKLLADWQDGDVELRGFAGGYFFDRSTDGFEAIAGPRVRAELRLYDLDLLGEGSRLVLGGAYEYDDVRGSQGSALLQVRVPFGPGAPRRLNRLQRRMLDPVVRDIDIVTNTGRSADEPALLAKTGDAINQVTVFDATESNLPAAIAGAANGPGDLVVLDPSQGTFLPGATVQLQPGQTVGGQFQVIGERTGAIATFGQRPTISDPSGTFDIFELDDNSSLLGLDIVGGTNGVVGNNVTGFSLCDNHFSGAVVNGMLTGNGVALNGLNSGDIINNVATGNENDGFQIEAFDGGTISGNRADGNTDDGFNFIAFLDGEFTNNSASDNDDNGMLFLFLVDGTLSMNSVFRNGDDGLEIGEFDGGTLSNNRADNNVDDGFDFGDLHGGLVENNTANGNQDDGFDFEFIDGGIVQNNSASGSTEDGFVVDEIAGGLFQFNTSTGNLSDGFEFGFVDAGTITGNSASGNTEDGFFIFSFEPQNAAVFNNNSATDNTDNGYNIIFGTPLIGGGNTGNGNGANNTGP